MGDDVEHADVVAGGAGDEEVVDVRGGGGGHLAGFVAGEDGFGDFAAIGVNDDDGIEPFAGDEELTAIGFEAEAFGFQGEGEVG